MVDTNFVDEKAFAKAIEDNEPLVCWLADLKHQHQTTQPKQKIQLMVLTMGNNMTTHAEIIEILKNDNSPIGCHYNVLITQALQIIRSLQKDNELLRETLCNIPRLSEYADEKAFWYDYNMWTANKFEALNATDTNRKMEE